MPGVSTQGITTESSLLLIASVEEELGQLVGHEYVVELDGRVLLVRMLHECTGTHETPRSLYVEQNLLVYPR
jgi:hypothetical protein